MLSSLFTEDSDTIRVMALVNIKKGSELTVNYFFNIAGERGEFCLTYEQRKMIMMSLYRFNCLCHECLQVELIIKLCYEKKNFTCLG